LLKFRYARVPVHGRIESQSRNRLRTVSGIEVDAVGACVSGVTVWMTAAPSRRNHTNLQPVVIVVIAAT